MFIVVNFNPLSAKISLSNAIICTNNYSHKQTNKGKPPPSGLLYADVLLAKGLLLYMIYL